MFTLWNQLFGVFNCWHSLKALCKRSFSSVVVFNSLFKYFTVLNMDSKKVARAIMDNDEMGQGAMPYVCMEYNLLLKNFSLEKIYIENRLLSTINL